MINEIRIFTDGSSFQHPRVGGFGIIIITVDENGNEEVNELDYPGYKSATNNQMELFACVKAIEYCRKKNLVLGNGITIFTDSMYVVSNYKRAMFQWCKEGWKNNYGKPIDNTKLWKEFVKEMQKVRKRVEIKWLKGHAGNAGNILANNLARKSAKNPLNPPLSLIHVRRKRTQNQVQPGCVDLYGQRITIRIITTEYLTEHKLWKCKYEVLTKGSQYCGLVDFVYSDELLQAGHTYYLQVNKEKHNPRVVKIFREIGEN
jgi:ribonuclease HI